MPGAVPPEAGGLMRSPCECRAHGMRDFVAFVVLSVAVVVVAAAPAHADALKGQRTVARMSASFAQSKVRALQKCNDKLVRHQIPGPCPDATTSAKIAKAETKMRSKVAIDCGGADHTCGTSDDT